MLQQWQIESEASSWDTAQHQYQGCQAKRFGGVCIQVQWSKARDGNNTGTINPVLHKHIDNFHRVEDIIFGYFAM